MVEREDGIGRDDLVITAISTCSALSATVSPAPEHNVVEVGIGEKIADGKPTGITAVKFLVQIKYPEGQLDSGSALPKTIDGLPVDVEQVGLLRRLPRASSSRASSSSAAAAATTMPNPRTRIRPARPGCSVGFQFPPPATLVMAGTFGAVVKRQSDLFILSNNHVLADENRLAAGAPIFQPGLLDGGRVPQDKIAELTKFIPLRAGVMNKVDCAIARVTDKSLVSKDILFIGPPRGKTTARIDMIVHKFGRTTSYRAGRITSVATDVNVQYETGTFTFEDQIIIVGLNNQPFSAGGDSGSLILERSTQRAVGLLFAGSSTHTIANHINAVLRALRVTLA